MVALNLSDGEAALVTRVLDFYLSELQKAAAAGGRKDLMTQFAREAPLLKEILEQLVAQQAA